MIRTREEKFAADEMPTKRALTDEKRYAKRNEISRIEFKRYSQNSSTKYKTGVLNITKTTSLLKSLNAVSTILFFAQLAQLKSDVTEKPWVPMSMDEIEEAIENLKNNESQGHDGLGAHCYKALKSHLAVFLWKVFGESFSQGCLPASFSQAYTAVIFMSDYPGQLSKVTGFTSITLPNTAYKVFIEMQAKI